MTPSATGNAAGEGGEDVSGGHDGRGEGSRAVVAGAPRQEAHSRTARTRREDGAAVRARRLQGGIAGGHGYGAPERRSRRGDFPGDPPSAGARARRNLGAVRAAAG